MLTKFRPHLWCSAEGGGDAAGGGAAPAKTDNQASAAGAAPAPAQAGGGIADVLGALGQLTEAIGTINSRIEGLEKRGAPSPAPTPTPTPAPEPLKTEPAAPPKAGPSKAETEARTAAEKATALAKKLALKVALAGLKSDTYLGLAPAVELDDAGNITEDGQKALAKFRKDHPDLFHAGSTGTTPTTVGGGTDDLSPEQRKQLAGIRVDPAKSREVLGNSPLAGVIGWQAPRQS